MEVADCVARARNGFTLVELVLAMGIFTVVLGIVAQILVSYYAALDLTQQRTVATQNAIGVLNEMRAVRNRNPDDFPGALLARFPEGTVVSAQSERKEDRAFVTLPGENITINYFRPDGAPLSGAELNMANPLVVALTSRWDTLRGPQQATARVSTILTNE
jgi:prepilin-type N-terminal cleavage/methylation domain-containing protein